MDDGCSGADFDRPSFNLLKKDIDDDLVCCIIVKDLSRFGRNYLQAGSLMEYTFMLHNIRFIAINDGVDTNYSETVELVPFKNLINEWYIRDTSRKIRQSKTISAQRGERLSGTPPFGYKFDPDDKKRIIPNPETAPIVQRIFNLCSQGNGPMQISKVLNKENVISPFAYNKMNRGENANSVWNATSVSYILSKVDYIGHTHSLLTTSISYKIKKRFKRDEKDTCFFKNTHEPIIDEETWEIVKNIRENKRRRTNFKEQNKYSGLVHCADCKCNMVIHRASTMSDKKTNFTCKTYKKNGLSGCTAHFIREYVLDEIVINELNRIINFAKSNEDEFVTYINDISTSLNVSEKACKKKELIKLNNRLQKVICNMKILYEDKVSGKIKENFYDLMMQDYLREEELLRNNIFSTQNRINELEETQADVDKFIKLAKQYTDIKELDTQILRIFISKIVIHEKLEKYSRTAGQKIEIYYNYIGLPKKE